MNLLIFGAGGHGYVCKEIAEAIGEGRLFTKIGFLDDNNACAIGKLNDYIVFRKDYDAAFIAFGNPIAREEWQIKATEAGYHLVTLVHPNAIVSKSAVLGEGSVVMQGAVVQSRALLGKGCIVSSGAIIDHDVELGDLCHINAGAIVPALANVPNRTKVEYGQVYCKSE